MSSWYSSWLSSLPTIDFAVPSAIQRRFFSFLLRRTLGHFLKPGQFDLHQIDSQLGSGTVQVKDLELDGQAIDQLLVGLPLSLYDGFISGVTARIPFPNPLSATVGLHVQSLNLTFQVTPEQPISFPLSFQANSNLADSVVSVAETFVHDELTPREEATLRQTLKPCAVASPPVEESENLPGGFNPFGHDSHAGEVHNQPHGDDDPAGVSVFATLIERLLARFEFSAADTKITIICPERASFTLSISEISYHTDSRPRTEPSTGLQSTSERNDRGGQIRAVSISGLKVTSRDLRVVDPPLVVPSASATSSRKTSPPLNVSVDQLSRGSSASSLDEDTQLAMSQSIAMLPPRSLHSPSASSSMYQSAVSMTRTHSSPRSRSTPSPAPQIAVENVLLSFGSQPIVFSLKTSSCPTQPSESILGDHSTKPEGPARNKTGQEIHHLSITVGTLACALRSDHLRVLLDIVDRCMSTPPMHLPYSHKKTSEPSPIMLYLEGNVTVRGFSLILLPGSAAKKILSLDAFYERPLVPPRLPCTYLRLFIDSLFITFRFPTPSTRSPMSGVQPPSMVQDQSTFVKLLLSDVSLFTFDATSSVDDSHVATAILITDHYLPMLHVAHHYRPLFTSERPKDIKLPKFDIFDWTQTKFKGNSTKLSTWRSKNRLAPGKAHTPSQRPSNLPSSPNPFIIGSLSEVDDKPPTLPAVEVFGQLASLSKGSSGMVDVKIAPLHFFLDLGTIFKGGLLMQFVEDVTSATIFSPKKVDLGGDQDHRRQSLGESNEDEADLVKDNPTRQSSIRALEKEEERRRLEALVLEDLNLAVNHHHAATSKSRLSHQRPVLPKPKRLSPGEPGFSLRLSCPMVRAEVRCPPPSPNLPRSGCLLVDLRDLTVSNDFSLTKPHLRFSGDANSSPPCSSNHISNIIFGVHLQEILIAHSLVGDHIAHAILTLGFLPNEVGADTSVLMSTETEPDTLPLSAVMGRLSSANESLSNPSNKLSINVDIPLINLIMDKATLDGLQCWADDVAQLIEQAFASEDCVTETVPSRNPSLIGSRYFVRPRRSGTQSTDESVVAQSNCKDTSETVVHVTVTEMLVRLIVPRNGGSDERPLDISALDVDASIELKLKDRESAISAGIMDLRIADTSDEGDCVILVHSPARTSLSVPRPLAKFQITSLVIPETTAKESRIGLSLWGFTVYPPLDANFRNDLTLFAKAPPGVFESVVPSECTRLMVSVVDVSIHLRGLEHPGAVALHLGKAEFSTELVGNSPESAFKFGTSSSHIFLVDSIEEAFASAEVTQDSVGRGADFWRNSGYASIAEIPRFQLAFRIDNAIVPPNISVVMEQTDLRIHLCADTISALTGFITGMTRSPRDGGDVHLSHAPPRTRDTVIGEHGSNVTASLDEYAFRLIPEIGSTADMISDDLPANQDYLDASFGTAAGLRELRDDDLDDFDVEEQTSFDIPATGQLGIVSNVGGETVRILKPFSFIEHYFDTIPPEAIREADSPNDTILRIRAHNSDIVLLLHDGFDWPRTRKIIEKEVKDMRKKLARIRQLVATGHAQERIEDATSTTLFNSLHIGLERDLESIDPDTLIAAIDDELNDAVDIETESSWQSLPSASPGRPRIVPTRVHGKRLTRSKAPSIEIRLQGLNAEVDNYRPGGTVVSRTLVLVRDLEILDHIKTSTWKKFLTDMRSDSRGNVRETESNMARVELLSVQPSPSHPAEEARLRAKILPLRLYVDQDALDFFKKFFAFQDPDSPSAAMGGERKEEIYFQHAEVFPVDIKLDYKPRRVDYRALRDGKTIELMNFFHFDGAEMTLRHLTLHGITGWPRFFDTLNDLWTPDVKATQLVDVISGVAPIRSVVNVGSGVADLVLLPIAQYKKDGRIVRGVQKGTKAFVQSTAMEAIKLGARLATGTQVILERAENVLGGQFSDPITAEALQIPYEDEDAAGSDEDLISRYATQPSGLREGVQSAYRSLQRNLHSAAQTILAVPMEIYEKSGNEGAVSAVVRAVPIAVLKPMIGASEAVSKTLMGLHNTLDPNIRLENEAKYKHH